MSRLYKNKLRLRPDSIGDDRRVEIVKGTLENSASLPKTLLYKDIDESFKEWVDKELSVSFEGKLLPTMTLYSSQRFSEYMQTWQNVDEKKNIILNFKAITRDNNPKAGTIVGQSKNIPGNHSVLMKTVEAYDKNNRKYYIDYRLKQPTTIDFVYTVTLLTNKYELLNEFNLIVNDKFKAINCYIQPNGHFIPMKLNDISDESEYSVDNRQFYSQSYNITVMGYVITEDDFIIEERPDIKFMGFEGENSTYAEIEEFPSDFINTDYEYIPTQLTINIDVDKTSYKFKVDTDFIASSVVLDNIRHYKIFVNDNETIVNENFKLHENDEIKVKGVTKYNVYKESKIIIKGHRYLDVQKK